jgi:hypothetical protein
MVTFTPPRLHLDVPTPAILIMASDPFFRCPCCGSLLTSRGALPGLWECHYCSCLFPVDPGENVLDTLVR